ncbi:hypothetical protein B0H10DRAFT_2194239, partial [Mycena sp. CBHHK59/15]
MGVDCSTTDDEGDDESLQRVLPLDAIYQSASQPFSGEYPEGLPHRSWQQMSHSVQLSPCSADLNRSQRDLTREEENICYSPLPQITALPPPRSPTHSSFSISSHPTAGKDKPLQREVPRCKNFLLHDNLYDYQDPWNAIGVILGLEDDGHENHSAQAIERFAIGSFDQSDPSDDSSTSLSQDFCGTSS